MPVLNLRSKQYLRSAALLLALAPLALSPRMSVAQAAPAAQQTQPQLNPITTGSTYERADAPESNAAEENYRHSKTVQFLAHALHVPVETAAQIFEDFNSGVLILTIAFFLIKYLPKAFRTRRETIERDLVDARSATELANQRLQAVEGRLAMLDTEIEGIRQQAAKASEQDEKRIHASMEAERERIVRSSSQEIAAAQAQAERELKRFAADLAIERAMDRIHLTAEADRVLIDNFADGLSAEFLKAAENAKRGQN